MASDQVNFGFWKDVFEKAKGENRPLFVLAPMADVTDAAFRKIIAKYSRHGEIGGGPDVFWTEFVSADGLAAREKMTDEGREAILLDFKYGDIERPIVAQIFGSKPENIFKAAQLIKELGFDGIDINMGCPDKAIERQGAGAAMMKNPECARAVIRAAKEGSGGLPVSVKTRLGFNKNEFETWIPEILEEDIAVLTIHGRTRKDMSKVPARWDDIAKVVEIVRKSGKETYVIGNGDALSLEDGREKTKISGVDGVMLGRAIFGNPWLFDEHKKEVSLEEKLRVMCEHTKLFETELGHIKNFSIMKKHYKAYVNNFDGAKELRVELMEAKDADEVKVMVDKFLSK